MNAATAFALSNAIAAGVISTAIVALVVIVWLLTKKDKE
jgi:hypothetical protein